MEDKIQAKKKKIKAKEKKAQKRRRVSNRVDQEDEESSDIESSDEDDGEDLDGDNSQSPPSEDQDQARVLGEDGEDEDDDDDDDEDEDDDQLPGQRSPANQHDGNVAPRYKTPPRLQGNVSEANRQNDNGDEDMKQDDENNNHPNRQVHDQQNNDENSEDLERDQEEEDNYLNAENLQVSQLPGQRSPHHVPQHGIDLPHALQHDQLNPASDQQNQHVSAGAHGANVGQPTVEAPDAVPKSSQATVINARVSNALGITNPISRQLDYDPFPP